MKRWTLVLAAAAALHAQQTSQGPSQIFGANNSTSGATPASPTGSTQANAGGGNLGAVGSLTLAATSGTINLDGAGGTTGGTGIYSEYVVPALTGATTITVSNLAAGSKYTFKFTNGASAQTLSLPGTFPSQCVLPPIAASTLVITGTWNGSALDGTCSMTPAPMLTCASIPSANATSGFDWFGCDSVSKVPYSKDASGNVAYMANPFAPITLVCAAVTSTSDVLANASVTTAQTFQSSCTLPGASTASTVDGTHSWIRLIVGYDIWGTNSPTFLFSMLACPVANWSAGSCSSGSSAVYTTAAGAINTGSAVASDQLILMVHATATPGTFNVTKQHGVNISGLGANPYTLIQANCTACSGGQYVLYFQITFGGTGSGTAKCLSTTTGGTNCVGLGDIEVEGGK